MPLRPLPGTTVWSRHAMQVWAAGLALVLSLLTGARALGERITATNSPRLVHSSAPANPGPLTPPLATFSQAIDAALPAQGATSADAGIGPHPSCVQAFRGADSRLVGSLPRTLVVARTWIAPQSRAPPRTCV